MTDSDTEMVNENGHGLEHECLGAAHAAILTKNTLIFTFSLLINKHKNKLISDLLINRHDGKH